MRYVASCSFGKDSLATILLARKHGEPLDEAVYCEVMFDKTISGEVPEHRDFIYTKGIPALEKMGIKVTILRSEKTYVDLFTGRVTRGPKKGMVRSFPVCGKCYVQRDCKLRPIERYHRFQSDLLAERPYIAARTKLTGYDRETGGFCCLLVTSRNRKDGILVDGEGYHYARYAAYVPNKQTLDLRGVVRDNLDLKSKER